MWVKCILARRGNPIIQAIIHSQVYPCMEANPIIQAIIHCKLVPIIDLYAGQVYPSIEGQSNHTGYYTWSSVSLLTGQSNHTGYYTL